MSYNVFLGPQHPSDLHPRVQVVKQSSGACVRKCVTRYKITEIYHIYLALYTRRRAIRGSHRSYKHCKLVTEEYADWLHTRGSHATPVKQLQSLIYMYVRLSTDMAQPR